MLHVAVFILNVGLFYCVVILSQVGHTVRPLLLSVDSLNTVDDVVYKEA